MTSPGYVSELSSLKNEISQLKEIITTAVAQMKQVVESFQVPHHHNEPLAMDTDDKDSANLASPPLDGSTQQNLDFPAIIRDLNNDIATILNETCAMISQCMPQRPKQQHSMGITLEIS